VDERTVVTARLQPLRSIDRLRAAVKQGEIFGSSVALLTHLLRDQADVLVVAGPLVGSPQRTDPATGESTGTVASTPELWPGSPGVVDLATGEGAFWEVPQWSFAADRLVDRLQDRPAPLRRRHLHEQGDVGGLDDAPDNVQRADPQGLVDGLALGRSGRPVHPRAPISAGNRWPAGTRARSGPAAHRRTGTGGGRRRSAPECDARTPAPGPAAG